MNDVLAVLCIIGAIVAYAIINEINYRRAPLVRPQIITFRPEPVPVAAPIVPITANRQIETIEINPNNGTLANFDPDDVAHHQDIEGVGVLVDVFPWLGDVGGNDPKKGNHHSLIAGESDAGKSTLARAMLIARSYAGYVLVLNPHAKRDNWGVPVIGGGRNFDELNRAMELLLAELDRRYDEPEWVEFDSLSIFIDEWPSIQDECPIASRFMKKLAMEGRKVRMRLVILSQSRLVEDLGLKGSSDIKKSFALVLLGTFAHQEKPELSNVPFAGVLLARGKKIAMATSEYPDIVANKQPNLANFYKLPGIIARSSWPKKESDQELLTTQKTVNFPFPSGNFLEKFTGVETPFQAQTGNISVSDLGFQPEEIARIAALIAGGEKGKTEIVKSMPGYSARKHQEYSDYYNRLAAALVGGTEH